MRVLMLNHEFPPLGGGAARASYEVGRRLVRNGHTVVVITTRCDNVPVYEEMNGVEIHRVYGKRRSALNNNVPVTMASYLILGTRLARQLSHQRIFDVVHAFFTIPAGLSGLWLKQRTGIPLVVSLRGSDVPYHNPDEFRLPIRLLSPVIAHVWRKADSVVALSDGLKETAKRTESSLSFDVIYNGVDTNLFKPPEQQAENEIPQLASVSRLVKCKGIQHLLKAAARLHQKGYEFDLCIVGDGNYRDELVQMRDQLGLRDRVQFPGYVSYEQLPAVYQEADIFVLPSLTESFGQVFAEAMACGLPVIGTTAGGIPEVVGPEQMEWLVPPGDVDALTEVMATVLQSPGKRREIGMRNAAYTRQRFSWASVADEYAALYAKVTQPSE